jgi:hypothetical protein
LRPTTAYGWTLLRDSGRDLLAVAAQWRPAGLRGKPWQTWERITDHALGLARHVAADCPGDAKLVLPLAVLGVTGASIADVHSVGAQLDAVPSSEALRLLLTYHDESSEVASKDLGDVVALLLGVLTLAG